MEIDSETLTRLYDVLDGVLAIDDFEDWFVSESWDRRTALVKQVTQLLVDRAVLDDEAFLAELRELVHTIVLSDDRVTTGASATTVTHHAELVGR